MAITLDIKKIRQGTLAQQSLNRTYTQTEMIVNAIINTLNSVNINEIQKI